MIPTPTATRAASRTSGCGSVVAALSASSAESSSSALAEACRPSGDASRIPMAWIGQTREYQKRSSDCSRAMAWASTGRSGEAQAAILKPAGQGNLEHQRVAFAARRQAGPAGVEVGAVAGGVDGG
jgi:hypothetical protein